MDDTEFPADPYPGAVPPFSFVHLDGVSRPLAFDGGWRVVGPGGAELDLWLGAHGAPPLAARVPLLAYGSNRNPSKITWLRRTLGLAGPVVVLRARTEGLAAVWASGVRARDGQRTSVLGAVPGAVERHALWLATPEQVAVLDRCEGRDDRYRLARLHTGTVSVDGGLRGGGGADAGAVRVEAPWCYLGLSAIRRPLLVDGRPVRCAEVGQAQALHLRGDPAPDDGLDAATVRGAPDPDDWPAAVFVYGTLQPGQRAWGLVADHAVGAPHRADVAGRLGDTGQGWPALLDPRSGRDPRRAAGWVVPVRDPARLLARLDAYEGPEYRRVRVAARDRSGGAAPAAACWTYLWAQPEDLLTPLADGRWPA
ncbi:MAG TPA: gamma-glutamylcyclotransferase family protein [Pseudonocardia sp.]